MKHALTLLALVSTGASASTLTLTPGQTGMLAQTRVTLLRAQDSRCPTNARCIIPGQLRVSLLINKAGRLQFLKLQWPEPTNSVSGSNTDATAGARSIRILSAPERSTSEQSLPLPVTLTNATR